MNGWRFWYGCFVVYINVSCCTKCGHVSRFLSSVRWICCVKCQIRGMETRWLDLTLMDLPWNCKRLAVRRACVCVWEGQVMWEAFSCLCAYESRAASPPVSLTHTVLTVCLRLTSWELLPDFDQTVWHRLATMSGEWPVASSQSWKASFNSIFLVVMWRRVDIVIYQGEKHFLLLKDIWGFYTCM